ncbi:MAG: heavy-metal-associated domain-containing protein [Roseateles sp.]|uniref:heavy-metal-associated domain-containing protein n=1 Tax=Roseateles sp. TaxID=1971397 RepID=UPI0039E9FB11
MISFHLPRMSCGGCARAVTAALHAVDPQARVQVDLAQRRVQLSPDRADAAAFAETLGRAGHPPQPLPA